MKRVLIQIAFASAVILLPLFAGTANACSCLAIPTPYEAFKNTPVVFAGKVTGSTDVPSSERIGEKVFSFYERHFRFTVEEAFKGIKGGEVVVSAGRIDSSCYSGFEVGRSYLIYAGGATGTQLYAHMCSRTNSLAGAQDDIHYIRELLKGVPEPRIYGSVMRLDTDFSKSQSTIATPLEGIKIIVEGSGRRFEAVTNKLGLFSFAKVPDGKYKVRPVMPEKYQSYWPGEEEFVLGAGAQDEFTPPDIHQGHTAFANFRVGWNNRISGRILDAEGNPITRAKAALLSLSGTTDTPLIVHEDMYDLARGKYDFSGLTPGKYILSLSIRAPFPPDRPTRFYYPSAVNINQASEIVVGEKDSPSFDLKLPAGYVIRPIEGLVVWPDGSTVGDDGWVFLADAESSGDDDKKYDWTSTDKLGQFSLQAFDGAEYWLHASVRTSEMRMADGRKLWDTGTHWLRAQPVRIKVGKSSEPLRIVVPLPEGVIKPD